MCLSTNLRNCDANIFKGIVREIIQLPDKSQLAKSDEHIIGLGTVSR